MRSSYALKIHFESCDSDSRRAPFTFRLHESFMHFCIFYELPKHDSTENIFKQVIIIHHYCTSFFFDILKFN